MTDPTLTITISRTSLSLSDLLLTATPGDVGLGISAFTPPALQARVTYAPDSADAHGSEAIAGVWQQSMLGFNVITDNATSEADAQTAISELAAAIGQFSFTVTTQVAGAAAQVWAADMGSIALADDSRSFLDLASSVTEHAITIPVYPIAS